MIVNLQLGYIVNLGNTCYLNSVLQCLAHSDRLVDMLVEKVGYPVEETDKITSELLFLIMVLKTGKYRAVTPRKVRNIINERCPKFKKQRKTCSGRIIEEQHDAHKLLLALIDTIKEEMPDGKVSEIFGGTYETTFMHGDISNPILTGTTTDPFTCLHSEIPPAGATTLESCLENLVSVNKVTDEFEGVEKHRIVKISNKPDILVIQLKRFGKIQNDGTRLKIETFIDFPATLNLGEITTTENTCKYELYGTIT